uniref:Uncharacterized protein n=1 Tax=Arundo donax TaxID=35708 RepID=A0A0A9G6C0_ARUDO
MTSHHVQLRVSVTVEQWIPLVVEIKPMIDILGPHRLIMAMIMTPYGTSVTRMVRMVIQISSLGHKVFLL